MMNVVSKQNKSILQQFIDNATNNTLPPLLCACHSTDKFTAEMILSKKKLEVRDCKVFGKKLLYFFYGKPAYEVSSQNTEKRSDDFYFPVCFIIDTNKIKMYKVYPFDSGAYKNNLYDSFLHKGMSFEEFCIEPSVDAIQKYVSVFYKNNNNYIKGCSALLNCGENSYLQALCNLHNIGIHDNIDERAYTVEIITDKDMFLNDCLIGVIVPEKLEEEFRNRFSSIEVIKYFTRTMTSPNNYNYIIVQKVLEFLERHGYI